MTTIKDRTHLIKKGKLLPVMTVALAVWVKFAMAGLASTPFDSGTVPVPENRVDKLVFSRLEQLGIKPASLCPDAVFVRRVYLDTIGTIPSAQEVKTFLQDSSPTKRNALIDRLLERDEFADYWAMKWCDLLRVKSEFPINLWPNAVQAYHHWIRASIKANMPYDQFSRELLTASGSNFRVPQVNFYRAVQSKDPVTLAQAAALTFMGTRADKWSKDRLAGMAVFFSQVGYKSTAEWKEEIVYFDPAKASNTTSVATFPDGTTVRLTSARDPREVFADWLVRRGNAFFSRAISNRVWALFI